MENLSTVLQIALTLASFAVILVSACLIPVLLQVSRHMEKMSANVEEVKNKVNILLDDTRELVQNVNELSRQINSRVSDAGEMLDVAREWASRTNTLVSGLSSTIELPFASVFRKVKLLQMGATTFFRTLFHPKTQNTNEQGE